MALTNPFSQRPAALAKLPRIVRLYICHCAIGFALAGVLTAMVLHYDFAGIGSLVANVDGGWLAAAVFFVLNGTVLSGVQTSIVIMLMDYDDDSSFGPRLPLERAAVPVRVRTGFPRR